jgi:stage V sporulation protein G
MFLVTEADADAIRDAYDRDGEFAAAVELRRRFRGIADSAMARDHVRAIVGWKPLSRTVVNVPEGNVPSQKMCYDRHRALIAACVPASLSRTIVQGGPLLMPGAEKPMEATERVAFTVTNARAISSKSIFALVDVEMQVAGISFSILGVQARHLPAGGSTVNLPAYRDTEGRWRPAIELPEELQKPFIEAVLDFLVDQGLARRRSIVSLPP